MRSSSWVAQIVGGAALAGCSALPPGTLAVVPSGGVLEVASSGEALYVAWSDCTGGLEDACAFHLDAISGGARTPLYESEPGFGLDRAVGSLAATPAEVYFTVGSERRIGVWDGETVAWIDTVGQAWIEAEGEHAWAESHDEARSEMVLLRLDGATATEVRRLALSDGNDGRHLGVLESGHASWLESGDVLEIDESGAIVGELDPARRVVARAGGTLTFDETSVVIERDGGAQVSAPVEGTLIGATDDSIDSVAWAVMRSVPNGTSFGGSPHYDYAICTYRVAGDAIEETGCTEPIELLWNTLIHGDAVVYSVRGGSETRVHELPLP